MLVLTACGGGGEGEDSQVTQPANIQLGLAIQQFDVEPCEEVECSNNTADTLLFINYVSHEYITSPSVSFTGCNTNSGFVAAGYSFCSNFGVSIANPNTSDNLKDTFRTGFITIKPEYMQNRLQVQQFNGAEHPIHFEVGVDLARYGMNVSAIINTRDYLDFDESVDGTYDIYLCLNVRTGEVHEASETPRRLVGLASGGMREVPLLSCFS